VRHPELVEPVSGGAALERRHPGARRVVPVEQRSLVRRVADPAQGDGGRLQQVEGNPLRVSHGDVPLEAVGCGQVAGRAAAAVKSADAPTSVRCRVTVWGTAPAGTLSSTLRAWPPLRGLAAVFTDPPSLGVALPDAPGL